MEDLRTTARRVMRATRLNTKFFAETVTYKQGEDTRELDVHCRHRQEIQKQDDGTEKVWDILDVEIDNTDLDQPPTYGDRLYRADEEQAYLFGYEGKHRLVSWHVTFKRQAVKAQGTRGER